MTAKGHVALALVPAVAVFGKSLFAEDAFGAVMLVIGSLLPDIDEKGSYIGRKLFFLSGIFKDLGIEHRGFTHFAIIPVSIALIGYIFEVEALIWLAYGIVMHDVGDMMTKGGIVSFLYPFMEGKRFWVLPRNMRFKTFSVVEKIVTGGLFVMIIFFLWNGV